MELERPPQEEKPKPAEGEEGGEPPAGEEEPKKGLNVYEHKWSKPGSQKNMSQWFLQQKKGSVKMELLQIGELLQGGFAAATECLAGSREQAIYSRIKI